MKLPFVQSREHKDGPTSEVALDSAEPSHPLPAEPEAPQRPRPRRHRSRSKAAAQPVSEPETVEVAAIEAAPTVEVSVTEDTSPVEDSEAPPRPRRRRRGRAKASPKTTQETVETVEDTPPAAAVEEVPVQEETAKPETPPRPRPRRRRRPKATPRAAPEAVEVPEAPPPPPSLEEIMARQSALLQSMADRQLAALRSIENSLVSLERRLAGGQNPVQSPRVGIFVDVPNVVYAADRLGVSVDFGKLLKFLARDRELVRASAYAPIGDDPNRRLEEQRFVYPFVNHGYRIVTKPLKRFANGSIKANFDVELAIDVLTMADRLDVVCLVSGDGDFRRLVELVSSRGVRVEVAAFPHSISAELRAICDHYIDLGEHLEELKAR